MLLQRCVYTGRKAKVGQSLDNSLCKSVFTNLFAIVYQNNVKRWMRVPEMVPVRIFSTRPDR